ncbi:hypothetical protein [Okeania sp. SIO3I5]|uniref:hypothetical protein n=1 Tax=Okeania sp. SIO3I5 TaxID=2607805 RepID=UPI0025D07448|nr:hypothetical protein [Okeania sp. SIO3I5]
MSELKLNYHNPCFYMKLIEKHIISKHHSNYQEIDKLCFLSKKQFNHAYADGIEGPLSNSPYGNTWKSELIIDEYLSINLQTLMCDSRHLD